MSKLEAAQEELKKQVDKKAAEVSEQMKETTKDIDAKLERQSVQLQCETF